MVEHVVIRREEYVGGTRQKPEVGIFTQTHAARPPVPWGQLHIGEHVWMKWSGGPIVATASVQGFRQLAACTADELRTTTAGYRLHDLHDYWSGLPPEFFGMTIYLADERWLDQAFVPRARSRGESWILVRTPDQELDWLAAGTDRTAATPLSSIGQHRSRGTRTVSLTMRFNVLRRDDFRCLYCGRRPPEVILHIDHVVPWSSGGRTVIDNLRTACADCNLGKGAQRLHGDGPRA
jgi:HNH endonuclease